MIGLLTFAINITEHHGAEQALQEGEALNKAVIASIIHGLIVTDKQGTIRTLNQVTE